MMSMPVYDSVLVFKELSWDSMRIVADGLLSQLSGIPVKLITSTGRIRLTLKKRISGNDAIVNVIVCVCVIRLAYLGMFVCEVTTRLSLGCRRFVAI